MTSNAPGTLIAMLENQSQQIPQQTAYTFGGQSVSYQQLWGQVNQTAGQLRRAGIQPRERVVLALPNGHLFFAAFFGCQQIGAIPVPILPSSSRARVEAFARLARAKHLIDDPAREGEFVTSLLKHQLDTEPQPTQPETQFPAIRPDDTAYIQFTSGSTGAPKGVALTHRNLLTNIQQMIAGMQITARDIFVSWLPMYHDMGLILMGLLPLFLGVPTHILPTGLTRMEDWLELITTQRATFTAGPDFAYRILCRHIQHPEDYDLSSLRVALNAAEPVRASTIKQFHGRFGLENVMAAGYGLAEATVGVAMLPPGTSNQADSQGVVSVGPPFPGITIKIIKDDEPLPRGQIGEIGIHSPANSRGYDNDPESTEALFWNNDYILSGDLGYLDEQGHLFIVGRKKNIIKHLGRTIAPRELEELVDLQDGLRFSAALGIDVGDIAGEQIYIFAEMRNADSSPPQTQSNEARVMGIVNAIYDHLKIRPARVVLLKPKSIPKTHNGKIQYGQLRHAYLAGDLAGAVVFSS